MSENGCYVLQCGTGWRDPDDADDPGGYWFCTLRPKWHDGRHEARDSEGVLCAVWQDDGTGATLV